tara:strand:- start:31 stop:396 length:366 start_codon:yes stop_codon:yes gene_type:complete
MNTNKNVTATSNGNNFNKFHVEVDGMHMNLNIHGYVGCQHPKQALKILNAEALVLRPVNDNNGLSMSFPVSVTSTKESPEQRFRSIGFVNPSSEDDYIDADTDFSSAEVYVKDDVDLSDLI